MNANTGRLSDAIQRLLPFIIVVLIVTFAYFWFIQTPLNAYLRTRTDVAALQARLQTARESVARASGTPPVDIRGSLTAFERQMSTEEKVGDVTAMLAKAVLESAPDEKLREFVIQTSDRISAASQPGGSVSAPPAAPSAAGNEPDARLALFPYKMAYAPVKVSFSSTFEGIASFIWMVRDFPTTVEVRTATLTRGLPFMKMELLLWVYQRGATIGQEPAIGTSPPAGPVTNPVAPRVARLTGAEG